MEKKKPHTFFHSAQLNTEAVQNGRKNHTFFNSAQLNTEAAQNGTKTHTFSNSARLDTEGFGPKFLMYFGHRCLGSF